MMKIITIIIILFCLLVPGVIWSQTDSGQPLKVLVVYYSRTGHTRLIAEKLAKKFNADLEELIDKKKRTGPLEFMAAGKDAVSSKTTEINPLKHNLRDYEIILIGGPSWFGNVTPAVRTFILQNDLTGKKIGLFGICHLTGVEHAVEEAAELIAKGKNEKFPVMALREQELAGEMLTKKINIFYEAMQEDKTVLPVGDKGN